MKISELITALEKQKSKHDDIDVTYGDHHQDPIEDWFEICSREDTYWILRADADPSNVIYAHSDEIYNKIRSEWNYLEGTGIDNICNDIRLKTQNPKLSYDDAHVRYLYNDKKYLVI